MPDIDAGRLMADLTALRGFGAFSNGVDRTALSPDDIAARRWVATRAAEAGLEPQMDRHGTVLGRCPRSSRAVLIGSHTDSVPRGGWLDGALGVAYGLEIARTLGRGVDVVDFQDEEGTYLPLLGSRSFVGDLTDAEIAAARRRDGHPLVDALASAALHGVPLRLDPARTIGFLEAHIEQGPVLEAAGTNVGIVTGIVGIRRWRLRAEGRADHAGTTPMDMRRDAGAALIALAARIGRDFLSEAGSAQSVYNIGSLVLRPGAANVVPAEAELTLEFRDEDASVLDRMAAYVERLVEDASGDVRITGEETTRVPPSPMAPALAALLSASAAARGASHRLMPSGAGHDAMVLARYVPSAMLFVPSICGRSHDITEDTAEADIVRGCQVMCDAAAALLATG
jgi:N-carbamoyl-L-amino-acid hydrolase